MSDVNPWLVLAERAKVASARDIWEIYEAIDVQLAAAGFAASGDWWRTQFKAFLKSGCRRWALRVGRRGGKSSHLVRLAVVWALYGKWEVKRGDVGTVAFISVSKMEASGRLDTIEEILKALNVKYETSEHTIDIFEPRRVRFRVFPCNNHAVGFTSIAVICDELARWRNDRTGANPAEDVIKSVAPTMKTIPEAFMVLSSSPWSTRDYHAKCYDEGPSRFQFCSWAPTWVAHPELTEEACRLEERDEATFQREYGAVPSSGLEDDWFSDAVDKAIMDESPPIHYGTRYYIAIDPAFVRDRFGWAVIASHNVDGKRVTYVHACDSWKPGLSPLEYAQRIRSLLCEVYKTWIVYSDQCEGKSFGELMRLEGITMVERPWVHSAGPVGKTAIFRGVRNAMLAGQFKIPNNPDLIGELRDFYGIFTDSGLERVQSKRGSNGHGDRVSAMIMAGNIALSNAAQDIEEEPAAIGSEAWHLQEASRIREEHVKAVKKRRRNESLREALGMTPRR